MQPTYLRPALDSNHRASLNPKGVKLQKLHQVSLQELPTQRPGRSLPVTRRLVQFVQSLGEKPRHRNGNREDGQDNPAGHHVTSLVPTTQGSSDVRFRPRLWWGVNRAGTCTSASLCRVAASWNTFVSRPTA